jgi:hypothetical protein
MITSKATPAAAGTVPVPLAALTVDGIAPTQGDPVEFTVMGKVVSVDGQTANVQVENINDQPAMSAEADDQAMMDAAMQADRQAEGY